MTITQRLLPFLFVLSLTACQQDDVTIQSGLPYQSDFRLGADGWRAGITDYSIAQDTSMHFKASWTTLPTPLNTSRRALMLESMNRSDDAFMYLTRKLTGLKPNTDYSLLFEVELASQYPANSFGIGGSPGSSVYLKAGASPVEPARVTKDDHYLLNIDKGEQSNDGTAAISIGNIGIPEDATGYQLITRSNADKPFTAHSNAAGELWLLIGTDSGYEGQTTLYYTRIRVSTKTNP